ncbi:hypothetical protein ACFX19_037357 [Malus domestica]
MTSTLMCPASAQCRPSPSSPDSFYNNQHHAIDSCLIRIRVQFGELLLHDPHKPGQEIVNSSVFLLLRILGINRLSLS